MSDQPRPVWLTEDLCGFIYTALAQVYSKDIAKADTFWQAWKAAPADPAEVVMQALLDTQGSARPADCTHVCEALGMPDA